MDNNVSGVRVSVVMAVYNAGRRDVLDAAIGSIVHQTMTDWELLICDDASTDDTPAWLAQWAQRDPRIRVVRNDVNGHAAKARNRCIAMAQGRYVAIMDADDICSENRLEAQAAFLDTHESVDFIGLKGCMFTREPGDSDKTYWYCEKPQPKDFLMTLPFVHASLMFRREALERAGGYVEGRQAVRSEDYAMLMRMYALGMRGVNMDAAVYHIREDAGTYRRRKYRYRIAECRVKFKGFAQMGLMPAALPFAVKPLLIGLLPVGLVEKIKKRVYKT